MALWDRERLTLVIEEDALRLMGVARGAVTRWGSAPLPRGTLAPNGAVANESALVEQIERLWSAQSGEKLAPRSGILAAIPGQGVPWGVAALAPPLPEREALAERARALLPAGGEEGSRMWQVVGPSSQPTLFVVAPPPALVAGYRDALDRAGLGLAAIDLKPLALVRGIGQRHALIVDSERARGTLILVEEAVPQQIEFVPLAAPLLATPEEKVARLVERLHEMLRRRPARDGGRPLHPGLPVFLTGTFGEHPLLRDALSAVLGRTLGRLEPPLALPPELPTGHFMANVGLAQKRI